MHAAVSTSSGACRNVKSFCTRFVVVYESLFHDQNVSLWSLFRFRWKSHSIFTEWSSYSFRYHKRHANFAWITANLQKTFEVTLLHEFLRCTFIHYTDFLRKIFNLHAKSLFSSLKCFRKHQKLQKTDLKFWKQISWRICSHDVFMKCLWKLNAAICISFSISSGRGGQSLFALRVVCSES